MLRNLIFEVFWPYNIEQILFFFSYIKKLWEKSFNFLKFNCITVLSLSTFVTNIVKDNTLASQTYTIKHPCHIYYTKNLLNLFLRQTCLARISSILMLRKRSISEQLPRTRPCMQQELRPLSPHQFGSLISPPYDTPDIWRFLMQKLLWNVQ